MALSSEYAATWARERRLRDPAYGPHTNAVQRAWRLANPDKMQGQRSRQAAARKQVKQPRYDAVNRIKLEEGCIDCGYNANPVALDFDHIRGIKMTSISHLVQRESIDNLSAEILKCEIRCANCHRIRTHTRGQS